jgi:hypothetical protein
VNEGNWQGSQKILREEYRGHGGIFIVLETINNCFSLELLLISFISYGSKLEPLLILLAFISSGSTLDPMLMRILTASIPVMNHY